MFLPDSWARRYSFKEEQEMVAMAARSEEGGIVYAVRSTLHEWKLILQRVRKPDKEDYLHASKIIWMAVLLVGSIAYVIHYTAYALLAP